VTAELVKDLASRSYFRYGQAIAADEDVKIVEQNTFNIVAHVQHGRGEKRTVELASTPTGFKFKCTCSNRKNLFCQHCVAVGLWMNKL